MAFADAKISKMRRLFLFVFALITFQVSTAQPPSGNAEVGSVYGEQFIPARKVPAKNINNKLRNGPVEGNIKGKVLEVCPKKGCWVKLELANKTVATVKMKDYGFFVPVSLEGKMIEINGKMEVKTTPVAELKHYAEDAKKTREEIEAITEPKEEVRILANSIRVIQ